MYICIYVYMYIGIYALDTRRTARFPRSSVSKLKITPVDKLVCSTNRLHQDVLAGQPAKLTIVHNSKRFRFRNR